ncbi:hypothetical protein ACFQJ8_12150 [Halocatena marina]
MLLTHENLLTTIESYDSGDWRSILMTQDCSSFRSFTSTR